MSKLSRKELRARDQWVRKHTGIEFMQCFVVFMACAVVTKNKSTIKSTEIVEELCTLDPWMFETFDNGAPISVYKLALILEVFEIKKQPICFESGTENGYYCDDIKLISDNYLKIANNLLNKSL